MNKVSPSALGLHGAVSNRAEKTWICGALCGKIIKEALNKSSAVDGGSFSPNLRFEKLEIHKVFLRFPNLALTKNLSVNLLAKFCDAALEIFKNWAVPRFAAQP